jgi:hypothetical protein
VGELLLLTRKKYFEKISEFLGSIDSYKKKPEKVLEKIQNGGFGEFVKNYEQGIPDVTTIIDGLIEYALENELKQESGVWRKRLVDVLNDLFVANKFDTDWIETINRIPLRELEKSGITYNSKSAQFETCRSRTNDGDADLLFTKEDCTWFASLIADRSIERDLIECYIQSGGLDVKELRKYLSTLDIVEFILQRMVISHKGRNLIQMLECLIKKYPMNDNLRLALEVLNEAIIDWGPRIEKIEINVEVMKQPDELESQDKKDDSLEPSVVEENKEDRARRICVALCFTLFGFGGLGFSMVASVLYEMLEWNLFVLLAAFFAALGTIGLFMMAYIFDAPKYLNRGISG